MRPIPYIGITGFTTNAQIQAVMKSPGRNTCYPYYMAGVLVSHKTLKGEAAKWPKRYPTQDELGSIFEPYAMTMNLVHYNTPSSDSLVSELLAVDDLVGPHCDGYQLNMTWPSPWRITEYHKLQLGHGPRKTIVLQCGARALAEVRHDVKELAQRVKRDYEGLVDYVLIDPSGGHGKDFDANFAFDCMSELLTVRNICPGIAGGLSAENVEAKLKPLLWQDMNEPFCIDAEGRLRTPEDELDLGKCVEFIAKTSPYYLA